MGFRKAIYDVEEKGLDPTKPHNEIGNDGRLKESDVISSKPAAANSSSNIKQEESTQKPSKGVAANSQKKKKVETPKAVTDKAESKDEHFQVTEELSDNKPKKEKKLPTKTKKITKTKTKRKTSSTTRTTNKTRKRRKRGEKKET